MGTVHYWFGPDDQVNAEAGPGFPNTVAVTIKVGVLGIVVEDADTARRIAASFAHAGELLDAAQPDMWVGGCITGDAA